MGAATMKLQMKTGKNNRSRAVIFNIRCHIYLILCSIFCAIMTAITFFSSEKYFLLKCRKRKIHILIL